MKNIAIIGAGMTGLSLAYNLEEHNITIFDKSWRPGGRVSTRKHDNYPVSYTHLTLPTTPYV